LAMTDHLLKKTAIAKGRNSPDWEFMRGLA